jgi:hypothetical protein
MFVYLLRVLFLSLGVHQTSYSTPTILTDLTSNRDILMFGTSHLQVKLLQLTSLAFLATFIHAMVQLIFLGSASQLFKVNTPNSSKPNKHLCKSFIISFLY